MPYLITSYSLFAKSFTRQHYSKVAAATENVNHYQMLADAGKLERSQSLIASLVQLARHMPQP
jgi:hypothetical protein